MTRSSKVIFVLGLNVRMAAIYKAIEFFWVSRALVLNGIPAISSKAISTAILKPIFNSSPNIVIVDSFIEVVIKTLPVS
jgi:hypothetical protein